MADWQILIDGVEKDMPKNWRAAEITVERDNLTSGLLRTFTSDLVFVKSGYEALMTIRDADFCDSATIELRYRCQPSAALTTLFDGTQFVADLEIDHWRCEASGQVEDQHFTAMIANNRKIKVNIGVGRSKDDTSYTAATIQSIDLFSPASGAFHASVQNIEMYTVPDAFEDLVHFMTNDTVDFQNDYTALDTLCVMRGEAINNTGATGFKPYISFDELFEEVRKKYNIGFYIDTSGSPAVLTIDELDNIFDSTNSVTFSDVKELKEEIDNSLIYSKVQVGAEEHNKGTDGYSWPDIQYLNHRKEEYHLDLECNSDNVLDLVSQYIIDSNIIEEVVDAAIAGTPDTSHDDDTFLIECNAGLTQAERYDIFTLGAGPYSYNKEMSNQAVIPRFGGVISGNLIIYLGDGNDDFEATLTSSTNYIAAGANFEPVTYDTEVSDPNGRYDNVTNYNYDSGGGAGWYVFECDVDISNYVSTGPANSGDLEVILSFRHYDGGGFGGGNLVAEYTNATEVVTADTTVTFTHSGFYMEANEDVRVKIQANWQAPGPIGGANFDIDGGTFKTLQAETGGGTYATFDKDDTRLFSYETEIPITHADFATMIANPTQAVTINIPRTATTKKGWIQELNFPVNGPKARLRIITTRNT